MVECRAQSKGCLVGPARHRRPRAALPEVIRIPRETACSVVKRELKLRLVQLGCEVHPDIASRRSEGACRPSLGDRGAVHSIDAAVGGGNEAPRLGRRKATEAELNALAEVVEGKKVNAAQVAWRCVDVVLHPNAFEECEAELKPRAPQSETKSLGIVSPLDSKSDSRLDAARQLQRCVVGELKLRLSSSCGGCQQNSNTGNT